MKTIKQIVIGCLLVVGIVFGYNLWMEYCLDDSNPNNYATIGDIPAPEGYIRVKQYLSLRSYQVARNIHDSSLMKRYIEELTRKERDKWQLSEVDKAMVKGAEKACEMIEDKAEDHLIRLTSRMEWFPVVYHLMDKVALVVLPVLGYYTGKYHLNDTMAFLWLMAAMPIFIMSVIWSINEVWAWLERRKKKPKLRA